MNFIRLLTIVFSIPLVSAQYYDFSDLGPETFLENEWFVFGAVFLLIFAFCYISLNNVLSGKAKRNEVFPWLKSSTSDENKGAIIVISLVIAFFSASVFVQRGWIYGFFGDVVSGWLFLIALIVIVILSVPFFKALKVNIGLGPAIFILSLLGWILLKYFVDPYSFYLYQNVPYYIIDIHEFITSFWVLIIASVIGILFTVIKNSNR